RQRNDGTFTEWAGARSGVIRQRQGSDGGLGAARKARCVFEIVESHRSAAMKEPQKPARRQKKRRRPQGRRLLIPICFPYFCKSCTRVPSSATRMVGFLPLSLNSTS